MFNKCIYYQFKPMPTITQFLENFEIFPIETTLTDHPEILNALVDYASTLPNPLLSNENQCYVYPNKSTEILSLGTTYRVLVLKKQRKNRTNNQIQPYYPYLERLMKNTLEPSNHEETVLGFVNRILVSLTKKTPQIYEFLKDNQTLINRMIDRNVILQNLQQFFTVFITESTMTLYIFLKNIVLRTLMYRIIDEIDQDNIIVYETITLIYSDICNKLKVHIVPEDERQQLIEISQNFHEENFLTLMVLKISISEGEKTYFIAKYLNDLLSYEPQDQSSLILGSHLDTLEEYFQNYEDSSIFMDLILKEHLQMLKIFVKLALAHKLTVEQEANLLKRLLVYSSIHRSNSILHCMLFDVINGIFQDTRLQVFNEINVVPFLMKNSEEKAKRYGWKSLIWKICHFWKKNQKQLFEFLQENQREFVNEMVGEGKERRKGMKLYGQKEEIVMESELTYSTEELEKKEAETEKKQENSQQKKQQ